VDHEPPAGPGLSALPAARRPLGLVLGAGGARGVAHIGVLGVLEREGLPIDLVVGASMGALVAAGWAVGLSAEAMARAYTEAPLRQLLLRPCLRQGGLIHPGALEAFLTRLFGPQQIEELDRPFAAVAVSLRTGREVVIRHGPLVDAVMASIAIPLVFPPRRLRDDYYVDGGLVDPVPTSVAQALGARTVVAVDADVHAPHPVRDTPLGPLARLALAGLVRTPEGPPTRGWVLRRLAETAWREPRRRPSADVLIQPAFGRMTANSFHRGRDCLAWGEAAARAALPRLRALAAPDPSPAR
jgi:NTE family protein